MKILFLFWRTSNCQWAAWRSCLACSRAQPAANTNWLIITCSRSESMAVIVEVCWRRCQLSWPDRCSTLARCLTSRKHEMRKNGRRRRRGGASLVVYTQSALRERLERTWPSTEQNNEASVLFLNGCAAFCVCWGKNAALPAAGTHHVVYQLDKSTWEVVFLFSSRRNWFRSARGSLFSFSHRGLLCQHFSFYLKAFFTSMLVWNLRSLNVE